MAKAAAKLLQRLPLNVRWLKEKVTVRLRNPANPAQEEDEEDDREGRAAILRRFWFFKGFGF